MQLDLEAESSEGIIEKMLPVIEETKDADAIALKPSHDSCPEGEPRRNLEQKQDTPH